MLGLRLVLASFGRAKRAFRLKPLRGVSVPMFPTERVRSVGTILVVLRMVKRPIWRPAVRPAARCKHRLFPLKRIRYLVRSKLPYDRGHDIIRVFEETDRVPPDAVNPLVCSTYGP